jgi:hypothetical protein
LLSETRDRGAADEPDDKREGGARTLDQVDCDDLAAARHGSKERDLAALWSITIVRETKT